MLQYLEVKHQTICGIWMWPITQALHPNGCLIKSHRIYHPATGKLLTTGQLINYYTKRNHVVLMDKILQITVNGRSRPWPLAANIHILSTGFIEVGFDGTLKLYGAKTTKDISHINKYELVTTFNVKARSILTTPLRPYGWITTMEGTCLYFQYGVKDNVFQVCHPEPINYLHQSYDLLTMTRDGITCMVTADGQVVVSKGYSMRPWLLHHQFGQIVRVVRYLSYWLCLDSSGCLWRAEECCITDDDQPQLLDPLVRDIQGVAVCSEGVFVLTIEGVVQQLTLEILTQPVQPLRRRRRRRHVETT